MENPASWSKLIQVITDELEKHDEGMAEGKIGYSRGAAVAHRLEAEGFVTPAALEPAFPDGWNTIREQGAFAPKRPTPPAATPELIWSPEL